MSKNKMGKIPETDENEVALKEPVFPSAGKQYGGLRANGNNTIPQMPDIRNISLEMVHQQAEIEGLIRNGNMLQTKGTFDGSDSGYKIFTLIQYQQMANYVSSLWRYNDAVLKDLGLKQARLDRMLLECGSLAVVKGIDEKMYILPYKVLEHNIYNDPIKIEIEPYKILGSETDTKISSPVLTSKKFENVIGKPKQFVIIWNSPDQTNKFIDQIGWHRAWYNATSKLNQLTNSIGTHLFTFNENYDVISQLTQSQINDFINSDRSVLTINGKKVDLQQGINRGDFDAYENFQNSFKEIEITDVSTAVKDIAEYFKNQVKEVYGVEINVNEKLERVQSAEVNTQQGLANAQKQAMINCRQDAFKEINETWTLGWELEILEIEGVDKQWQVDKIDDTPTKNEI